MNTLSHRSSAKSSVAAASLSSDDASSVALGSPDWLSAFADGEAGHDAALPLPDALHSARGRSDWDVYHLIGDVLRTPELSHGSSPAFQARLMAALEDEPAIIAAPRPRARRFMVRYGLPGLAAAAAVASVTWMAQPYFGGDIGPGAELSAQAQQAGQILQASGGVVPVSVQSERGFQQASAPQELPLRDYLDAHLQISGRGAIREVSATSPAVMFDRGEPQR